MAQKGSLRLHAEAILKIARETDSTSVLRGIHRIPNEGAEVRIGNDSGDVDCIMSSVSRFLPLSTTTAKQDVMNGGHELSVTLDARSERALASARANAMLVPRLVRYAGMAVLAAAVATQALSNQRAAAVGPALSNLINATLGERSSEIFDHAVEAARERAGYYMSGHEN